MTTAELDLLPGDVETDLRSTVRGLLADRLEAGGTSALNAIYDGDRSVVAALWRALAVDLGLAGLLVPEDRGGAGASAREAAAVLEELGRAVAPVPFLTSAVLATTVLLPSGSPLLAELASGERTAALAVPWSTAPHAPIPTAGAGETVTSVAGALEADVLLVPVRAGERVALHAVPVGEATLTAVTSLDMTRQLADVRLGELGDPVLEDAEAAIRRGLTATAALLASEQVGVARWCLEETTAYLKVRTQFGRVLGGFQALKHRLADLYTDVESGSAAATYAAAALAEEARQEDLSDLPVATALAASYCGDLAVRAAEEALQLHGGIGMTWEHPTHLRLKRAKADQIALGTPGAHRARLADLVNL